MVTIPESIWTTMLDVLATVRGAVERVAYLDGFGQPGDGTVITVVVPDADLHPSWYDVSPDAMSEAARHMREHGLVRLAQVHTHGDRDGTHSPRDDEKAYSQRPGALSIVLPYHASRRPDLSDATVHVRTADGWTPMTSSDASHHVRCVPTLIDLRRSPWNASQTVTKGMPAGFWRRLIRKMRSQSGSK